MSRAQDVTAAAVPRTPQRPGQVLFLQDELARVAKETEEAVAIRKQEHEVFVHAKSDHDEVIAALETAITAGSLPRLEFLTAGGPNTSEAARQSLQNAFTKRPRPRRG